MYSDMRPIFFLCTKSALQGDCYLECTVYNTRRKPNPMYSEEYENEQYIKIPVGFNNVFFAIGQHTFSN